MDMFNDPISGFLERILDPLFAFTWKIPGWLRGLWKHKALMLVLLLFVACAPGINIVRHPDYNYSPTDPTQMKVYLHGLTPTHPYVIIGKLTLTANAFTSRSHSQDLKIFKRAAQVGADGIIMTDMDIDIYAFNQYVTTQGFATLSGNSLSYFQVTRPYASYWVTYIFYGYLIKATK